MQKTVGGVYVPYIDSVALGALGSGGKDIGLGGTRLRSLNGNLIDSLETVSSLSVPAWPTPVTLHDTDKVQITYTTVSPLMADSAVAVLKPTKINVHSVVPLHWGDVPKKFAGTLNLPAASLGLNAVSTIGFPMDLTIALSAKDPVTGQQATLSLPAPSVLINADASTLVSFDSVAVGQFVSTFTRFSGRLPDSLRVDGFVIVNPIRFYNPTVAGAGAVSARSSVGGTVNVDLPLKFGLAGGIYRDTTAVGLQKDDIKAVNSGTMYIEVLNALPVQVSVTAAVIDSAKSKVLILVPQSGLPVNVVAASVTGTGIVNVPARSSTSVSLNSSEVQLMAPNRNFAYAVTLSTTPGSPTVAFRSTDSVKVKVWSSFSYQVNK